MVKGTWLDEYLQACRDANMNTFKRDLRLNRIFEHASIEQGLAYLDLIKANNPQLLQHKFTNDDTGGAQVYDYGNGHVFSPSTLQYIGVLSNLITRFGLLDGMRIIEVGGGYGGQCKTIMDVFHVKRYCLVDLPEVLHLQEQYLKGKYIEFHTGPKIGGELDLFISNYALSEIPNNAEYIDLARRCKHGYITCNTDFVQLDWPHEKIPDIYTERETNYILIW